MIADFVEPVRTPKISMLVDLSGTNSVLCILAYGLFFVTTQIAQFRNLRRETTFSSDPCV